MKKIIIIALIIFIIYQVNNTRENIIIPSTAIRLRIIANSNNVTDQYMKNEAKKIMEKEIATNLNNVDNIEESRNIIKSNIINYQNKIKNLFRENDYPKDIDINFGLNYFPKKVYKGVTYEEGKYESLVITIGSGEGDNWWCVLFPPLCLLEGKENEEVEYKFKVIELLDKLFN